MERIFHEHQHDDMQSYGHMTIHGGAVAALKDVAADLLREGERRGRERAIAVIENTLASTLQDRLINEIRARGENSV